MDFENDELPLGERHRMRSIQEIIVQNAVAAAVPRDLASDCWTRQITVVVDAPNQKWAGMVTSHLQEMVAEAKPDHGEKKHPSPHVFQQNAGRLKQSDDHGFAEILNRLRRGASIVGVFGPTSQPLPMLTAVADFHIEISAPGPTEIAKALSVVLKETVDPATLPTIDGFDLDRLAFAVCPRGTVEETLIRLRKLTRPIQFGDDVPDLRDFAAYGEARTWALSTLKVVERLRSGDPSVSLGDLPRGVLLAGPPGTGKTLFARSLAKTLGMHAVMTSASEWLSSGDSHLGAVIKAMRSSVEQARAATPAILFIDECDSVTDRDCETGGLPPEKWSSLMYGFWPFGGLLDAKEEVRA